MRRACGSDEIGWREVLSPLFTGLMRRAYEFHELRRLGVVEAHQALLLFHTGMHSGRPHLVRRGGLEGPFTLVRLDTALAGSALALLRLLVLANGGLLLVHRLVVDLLAVLHHHKSRRPVLGHLAGDLVPLLPVGLNSEPGGGGGLLALFAVWVLFSVYFRHGVSSVVRSDSRRSFRFSVVLFCVVSFQFAA